MEAAQAGHCVSVRHEDREGREVGQLCGGVNRCLCQQDDAGLTIFRARGAPEAGADPETTWVGCRGCVAHMVLNDGR